MLSLSVIFSSSTPLDTLHNSKSETLYLSLPLVSELQNEIGILSPALFCLYLSVLSFSQPGHICKVSQWFYRCQPSVLQLCVSKDLTPSYRDALFPHFIDSSLERPTEQTENHSAHISSLCVYTAVWS